MSYFLAKCRKYAARIAAVVLIFGTAFAVLAYFLGMYEISFLERPEGLVSEPGTQTETETTESVKPGTDTAFQESMQESDTGDTNNTSPELSLNQIQRDSVLGVVNPVLLSDSVTTLPGTNALASIGYLGAVGTWNDETMRLAKIPMSVSLPKQYSRSMMNVEKVEYRYPEDNSEYTAEMVTVEEKRPVLSVYMGYILYDTGTSRQLIDKNGRVLMTFDDTVTIPGNTRDRNGIPLFYRWSWDAEEGMVKTWYRLSDDASGFVYADYDDERENRGLYYDYPASYGLPDNTLLTRMWEDETAVMARLEEEDETKIQADTEWNAWYESLTDETERLTAFYEKERTDKAALINAPRYEEPLIAYFKNGSNLTGYKFVNAFPFKNGFAAVTENTDRRSLYFINEYGTKVLGQVQSYYMASYERYVISCYRMPASFGIESIGSFYFDHGLVRVRKQILDNYALNTYNNVRVIIDEDVLIDRTGKEFSLPTGYILRAYSNGMILLEKDGRFGFMDYTGHWIAEPVFSAATPFVNGLATLTTPDGRVGMIDTKGNIVLPFAYESISQASDGVIVAYDATRGWTACRMMVRED